MPKMKVIKSHDDFKPITLNDRLTHPVYRLGESGEPEEKPYLHSGTPKELAYRTLANISNSTTLVYFPTQKSLEKVIKIHRTKQFIASVLGPQEPQAA